jgi:hypothetical protein
MGHLKGASGQRKQQEPLTALRKIRLPGASLNCARMDTQKSLGCKKQPETLPL